jgi:hypothetical protein
MIFCNAFAFGQSSESIRLKITDQQNTPITTAMIELLNADSSLIKVVLPDTSGLVSINRNIVGGRLLRVSAVGYTPQVLNMSPAFSDNERLVSLQPQNKMLENLTLTARKSFIELKPDRTVVNLEAGTSTVGTSVMEALEKLPGVTIDKEGNIGLKGRAGVLVMIDGKPTYLNGSDLVTLLNGMSSSQVSQVELMDNPPAKYDAGGNAGIINIKTKKNNQRGFHGTLTTSYAQGFYPRGNNNLTLNYRVGKFNLFLNHSLNAFDQFTKVYALRTYYKSDRATVASLLEQPSFLKTNGLTQNVRTGIDYAISSKTSLGLTLSGLAIERKSNNNNPALWMNATRQVDSLVNTKSKNNTAWRNGGIALNFRHSFNPNRDLSADVDILGYRIRGNQFFENYSVSPVNYSEASYANIPTDINIITAKADYSAQLKSVKLEGGWKSSNIKTDNLAAYQIKDGNLWLEDFGKSNHFLYEENIHAIYANTSTKQRNLSLQGGLRYEMTAYDARQLGNQQVKDSSFSRTYNSFFPSVYASFEKDSSHTFTLSAGRRIDRPAFQKLNPFLFIINKYTYQQGNPFYRPQYTWNIEINHLYKSFLITGLSYSVTSDYFSQIFPIDSSGIVLYTEGNLSRLQNIGLSVGMQLTPVSWWSFSMQTVLNRKKMQGVIGNSMTANITQYNINLNNQFRFKKGWGGEITGYYNSKSQQDIQEILDPSGQLSLGLSKSVLQNKATIKLAVRDVFYTNWIKGLSYFNNATEYFKLTRDTRIAAFSFTWRFGRSFKTNKRSEGSAGDEVQRVGNG